MSFRLKFQKWSSNNKFSYLQFILFSLNFIVGFGFVATLSRLSNTGPYSILSLAIATVIAFGSILVFSRLSQQFPDAKGGVFGYSQLLNKKHFNFFAGWNQISQIFFSSALAPLFLSKSLKSLDLASGNEFLYIVLSMALFIVVTLLPILGLRLSKWMVFGFMTVKWLTYAVGILLVFASMVQDLHYSENFSNFTTPNMNVIAKNAISFLYAYAGFGQLVNSTKDFKFVKVRKSILISLMCIILFYGLVLILFLGVMNLSGGFLAQWRRHLNLAGAVLFLVGIVSHNISSEISSIFLYTRMLAPFGEVRWLPAVFARVNKYNEYWVNFLVITFSSVLSTVIFTIGIFNNDVNNQFDVILDGIVFNYLVNYALAFITAIWLHYQKKMQLPQWERIAYGVILVFMVIVALFAYVPTLSGLAWTRGDSIIILGYVVIIGLGYLICYPYHYWWLNRKKTVRISQ